MLNNTYLKVGVAAGREPWGSYFNERMVFFGEANRRDLALLPAGAKALDGIAQTLQVDARNRAQVQRDIAAVWEGHYAKVNEVNDELA